MQKEALNQEELDQARSDKEKPTCRADEGTNVMIKASGYCTVV